MIKLGTKVYRNIQEQVAKNTDDIAKLWRRPIFQIKVVEELPEEGEASTLYLLPVEDPEEGNYYEEYLWVDGAWELIGTTAVDISNMVTTDTDQTITGQKTFANGITFDNDSLLKSGTQNIFRFFDQNYQFIYQYVPTLPYYDGTINIGSTTAKWKDIYLGGDVNVANASHTIKFGFVGGDYYWRISWDGANALYGTNSVVYSRQVVPMGDNAYDLGSSSARWKDGYLNGKLHLYSETNNDYNLYGDGAWLTIKRSNVGIIQFYDTIIKPYTNNSVDLGTTGQKFKDIYLAGNITDGTNNVSIADLAALITYAKAQGWIS